MATLDTSASTSAAASPRIGRVLAIVAPPVLLVLGMAVATHSVVRYKLWIVAVYTVLAALLALWVIRSGRPAADPPDAERPDAGGILIWSLTGTLALVAVLQLTVRPYTYLTMHEGWLVRGVYAASAVLVAVALLGSVITGRRRLADLGLAVAVIGYLVAAALLIHLDPTPKIDVWVMLQQTADGIRHGKDMYTQNWTGSPGVQDSFTYLPFTGLLLAPGRWLAGDVRWALVTVTLLGVLAVRLLAQPVTGSSSTPNQPHTEHHPGPARASQAATLAAVGSAALLLLMPGTATQVEQAWTEPLLMACLAGWALGVQRRNTVLAVVCLALGVASKQHLIVLLPVLAAWPRFGPRRALTAGALAGLFVLPWIIASPKDIWHDAVTVLVHFQPLIFADTLYIAAVNDLSWTPPFWLTGAAVLITLGAAVVQVHRRNPDLGTVLRWGALFLFVANLVNKQAFYNQYWLVAALVVISLAVPGVATGVATPDSAAPDRAVPDLTAPDLTAPDLSVSGSADSVLTAEPAHRPAAAEA
jgi:hypothetical protein